MNTEIIIEPLNFQSNYFICEVRYKVGKSIVVAEGIVMLTLKDLTKTVPLHCTLKNFEEEHPEFFL